VAAADLEVPTLFLAGVPFPGLITSETFSDNGGTYASNRLKRIASNPRDTTELPTQAKSASSHPWQMRLRETYKKEGIAL
jgi:hypothetical protein